MSLKLWNKEWAFLFSLLLALSAGMGTLCSQEKGTADTAPITFDAALEAWQQNQAALASKKEAINSAPVAEQDALRENYKDLIDEANKIIQQLKDSGLKHLDDTPQDPKAIKTLLGIMMNDATFGRDFEVLQLGDELIKRKLNEKYFEVAAESDRLSLEAQEIFEELIIRHREAEQNTLPRVKFQTTQGEIILELFENEAPNTVGNFVSLVEKGFYDGLVFHRVLEKFMAQGGCPDGKGSGGPGYKIYCESTSPEARRHFTGSLSMAHAGRDTGGSQFFLCFKRTSFLDEDKSAMRGRPGHTAFGRVIEGFDVLENLTRTHIVVNGLEDPIPNTKKDVIEKATVVRKRDHKYFPVRVGAADAEDDDLPPLQPEEKMDEDDSDAPDEGESEGESEGGSDESSESSAEETSPEKAASESSSEESSEEVAEESSEEKVEGGEEKVEGSEEEAGGGEEEGGGAPQSRS